MPHDPLKLIRSFLRTPILIDGQLHKRQKGVPQGSPFCPLLSNILLNELDKELEKRGHRDKKRRSLIRLGIEAGMAYAWSCSRMGGWAIAQSPIMGVTVTEERLAKRGYKSFLKYYEHLFHGSRTA